MATIVTKNSSTASAVPTTSDLVQGELAVNVTDKRIFTENASTQIVELGTNPSTITTATATVTGTLTANGTFASNNAVITGGSINSTPIGATTPSTVRGSTVTATTGFVGGLTGNVTGNLTGNVTGNVVGNVTGNLTGNVTASSGTTTLNDLVVNGTADFTNTKLTNITTPTLDSDAANKGYVDATVAAVIDSAPAALDTLNELAAALGDDANFSATVTTALATKLPLAGGTMTGAIAMGTSKITGLGDPTASQDAATKIYVDTADNLKLNLSGGTMSGAIAMGTNKITGLGDPTLAQDAATKAYTDSILGSATSAAASAAAAATSESNAATSASNASTSETNALNSANAAASSYDQFDDRYLGDKASDPTLDNDGNALLTGALYFNTTSDVMKVYDGSAWNIAAISSASPTFTGTITADGLSLGDNEKATFGNSNDLEIYHNGTNSYIDDTGTGSLIIRASTSTLFQGKTAGENQLILAENGAVTAYYDNAQKLATTATGIVVTGTAVMDELDVSTTSGDATIFLQNYASARGMKITKNYDDFSAKFFFSNHPTTEAGILYFKGSQDSTQLSINATGDISFYEDTGTTPKFFWDASAESLGIGTTSPETTLEIAKGDRANGTILSITNTLSDSSWSSNDIIGGIDFRTDDGSATFPIRANIKAIVSGGTATYPDEVALTFSTADAQNAAVEAMRIDSSGNVGIGTTSPGAKVTIENTASASQATALILRNASTLTGSETSIDFETSSGASGLEASMAGRISGLRLGNGTTGALTFSTTNLGVLSERMRIDSSGNLLVGKTAADYNNATRGNVEISGSSSAILALKAGSVNDYIYNSGSNFEILAGSGQGILFQTNGSSERMRIDSSGNVGIGTASPSAKLDVAGQVFARGDSSNATFTNSGQIALKRANNSPYISFHGNTGTRNGYIQIQETGAAGFYVEANQPLSFATNNAERMRIDASGNLLVGKTSQTIDTVGAELLGSVGKVQATRDGGASGGFNRKTSDGNIVKFYKDGTTVGSIGVNTTRPYIASTSMGLKIAGTEIHSTNSSGTSTDDTYNVGSATYRWNDIYATNAIIQTSDRNEKQDIAELSDAEQRVAVACKGLLRKFRWKSAVEEKGDDARIHFGIIAQDLQAAFTAEGLDAGRYAMFIHSTWTDEETGEERSRMGVRYSELLAFIIAAL